MYDFTGKVAVVTGGSSGMGKAAALRFAQRGAKVALTADKNIAGAKDTVDQISAMGGEAMFMQCDVASAVQVEAFMNAVVQKWGRLDIAFNNAGIGIKQLTPMWELDEAIWDDVVDTDLKGVFLCMKYELGHMVALGNGGAIVNNSSAGAIRPLPGDSAYAAAKRGVVSLTISGAQEAGKFGVRVNCVCPSGILGTNLTKHLEGNTEIQEMIKNSLPLRRIGTVDEVADLVEWLCSDASRHVTGQTISADGGQTIA